MPNLSHHHSLKAGFSSIKGFLLFIIILLSSVSVRGSDVVRIDDSLTFMEINNKTEYYLDSSNTLTFSDIETLDSGSFTPLNSNSYKLGLIEKIIWIRFRIDKTGTQNALLSLTKLFSYTDFYIPRETATGFEYQRFQAGTFINTPERKYPYRYPVIELSDNVSSNHYIYVQIKPFSLVNHMASNFSFKLENEHYFYRKAILESALFMLLVGALLALAIYNFFLAISLKSRLYSYYVAYILGILFYIFLKSRVPAIFGFYKIDLLALPAIAVSYALAANFSRAFLESKVNTPLLDKLLLLNIVVSLLVLVLLVVGLPVVSNSIMYVLAVIGPIIFISTGVARLRQGYTPARYYLLAWIILGAATVMVGTSGMGLVDLSRFLDFVLGVGTVCEALLLSLALGDKINVLQQEKLLLTEISIRDELTGLFNKRIYLSSIQENVKISRQHKTALSLLVLDMDNFKSVNDEYGHAAGDSMLKTLSLNIIASVRPSDIACRYGGEEFAIILRETSLKEAIRIAERLRNRVAKSCIKYDSGTICRTVSIGVASLLDSDDEVSIFDRADGLLYRAKENGKNRIESQEED